MKISRRSRLLMMYAMLVALEQSMNFTNLMYKLNVSSGMLKQLIKVGTTRGVIKFNQSYRAKKKTRGREAKGTYSITEDGKVIIEFFERIFDILGVTSEISKLVPYMPKRSKIVDAARHRFWGTRERVRRNDR